MNQRKTRNLRQQVAVEAARIIAAGGQRNYLAAKQKAAERLGISSRLALPSNREVEDELRTHLNLYGNSMFGDAGHAGVLDDLRSTALEAMQQLAEFHPRLVGPVLEGTADPHSRICLHVFSDPADAVVMFLLNRDLPFRQESRRIRWHDGSHRDVHLVLMEVDGHTLELSLFSNVDRRQAPPDPISGKPQRRANADDVRELLETGEDDDLVMPELRR